MNALLLLAAWVPSLWEDQVLYELQQQNQPRICMPSGRIERSNPALLADAAMIAEPEMFQDPYRRVTEKYPVNTVPRFQIPLEHQIALEDQRTKLMERDVSTRGQLLNQRIAQQNLERNNRINDQTEVAIPELGGLDPASEFYEDQKAELIQKYPLAAENQGFQQMLGTLDRQANIQAQARQRRIDTDATLQDRKNIYYEQLAEQRRGDVARFGQDFLKQYDEALNQTGNPNTAFASVADKIQERQQQEKARQLEERPMTPAQVASEIRRNRSEMMDIMKQAGVQDPTALYGIYKDQYNDIARDVASLQGNPSNTGAPAQPAAPAYKEGAIAKNPQTGERIIFRNGKWESYK